MDMADVIRAGGEILENGETKAKKGMLCHRRRRDRSRNNTLFDVCASLFAMSDMATHSRS